MKSAKYLLLLLLFVGCNNQLTPKQKKHIRETTTKISCFTPEGWKDYWPRNGDAFWKGGWSFYNLEGNHIHSSIWHRETKSKVAK